MILKFEKNKTEEYFDGWVLFTNILNVYHHLITKEHYLELCKCDPYPFDFTEVDNEAKYVRIVDITRKDKTSLRLGLGNKTVYLLNDEGKTVEKII